MVNPIQVLWLQHQIWTFSVVKNRWSNYKGNNCTHVYTFIYMIIHFCHPKNNVWPWLWRTEYWVRVKLSHSKINNTMGSHKHKQDTLNFSIFKIYVLFGYSRIKKEPLSIVAFLILRENWVGLFLNEITFVLFIMW